MPPREFLFVRFPAARRVRIDGVLNGTAGETLFVPRGAHTVDLAGPKDYTPAEWTGTIANTGFQSPLTIEFTPKDAIVAPAAPSVARPTAAPVSSRMAAGERPGRAATRGRTRAGAAAPEPGPAPVPTAPGTSQGDFNRTLDAIPDPPDFRDRMFVPTLVEVPIRVPLTTYRRARVPILNQGVEGACTGFALATVVHYLLHQRKVVPDRTRVSARMLYEMARRYDEWPGESYSGSSARGAMKGWHKHGVCAEKVWPYAPNEAGQLTDDRASDGLRRPLGAYFRVNHRDLVAMHSAIAEVGILYATGMVHDGWMAVSKSGVIEATAFPLGGHAFAIVGYEERGFWIQNSWGKKWGRSGYALITYDDWMKNGTDVWAARVGAPVILKSAATTAVGFANAPDSSRSYVFCDLRPHIISLGNNGRLRSGGNFGTSEQDVREIFEKDLPRLTAKWKTPRLLLYAHGGLVSEDEAVQRVADYRPALIEQQIYPLSLIWKTDYVTTIGNILKDALAQRRPEGALEKAKDFLLDRIDDALEPLARTLTGKASWDEMKENGRLASDAPDGGMMIAAPYIAALAKAGMEIHLVAHSAGAIFMAHLLRRLAVALPKNVPVATCTLWAPACTIDLFRETYVPALETGRLGRLALYVLTEESEQADNCAHIYNKSLLYLVSNAFEDRLRIPLVRPGVPLLGLEKSVDAILTDTLNRLNILLARSPNAKSETDIGAARARQHVDFDDDAVTLRSTLRFILNRTTESRNALVLHSLDRTRKAQRLRFSGP